MEGGKEREGRKEGRKRGRGKKERKKESLFSFYIIHFFVFGAVIHKRHFTEQMV
jgi:hypothetical protein